MYKEYTSTFNVAGKEVRVSTGKVATQAHGSILVQVGGTSLLSTVTVDTKDTDLDYFPLGVEYIEKMYARGAISGSRFRKREGLPSDEAIIKAREVDHSIRSLFPKSFKKEVSVVLTVLSYDEENDPQSLSVMAASLALLQSGIPFAGPCASIMVGLDKNNNIIINPGVDEREDHEAEFIIAATEGKILSLEGWGREIKEEKMNEILDRASEVISEMNRQQLSFIDSIEKTFNLNPEDYPDKPVEENLINQISEKKYESIKQALFGDKFKRNEELSRIKDELIEELIDDNSDIKEIDISNGVEYIARKILREAVIAEDKRVSGRGLEEIRDISGEVDVLPTVHGSALFSRGLTQSLSIVTLASVRNELIIDDMEGESTKSFMHHYNMPPYANGETGRFRYHPGRREVGHGAIGENALKVVLPDEETFPYTIRAVSEILSSNGSTSMAATCAASMALMAAGVPVKAAVAGIGVGLVTEDGNEDNYKLLLDIEGIEDFYGDMDFKVCGTTEGITAIQYENKLQGVKVKVLKEAFTLAKNARLHVLEQMNRVIPSPRSSIAKNAPMIEKMVIDQDQIGELIGPGGKIIKGLIEQSAEFAKSKADISIDDSGEVTLTCYNEAQMSFLKDKIKAMFAKPSIGNTYEGTVSKVTEYGVFVDVNSNISGLCHISEISRERVPASKLKEMFRPGQPVKVKIIKIDHSGRVNFTMKDLS